MDSNANQTCVTDVKESCLPASCKLHKAIIYPVKTRTSQNVSVTKESQKITVKKVTTVTTARHFNQKVITKSQKTIASTTKSKDVVVLRKNNSVEGSEIDQSDRHNVVLDENAMYSGLIRSFVSSLVSRPTKEAECGEFKKCTYEKHNPISYAIPIMQRSNALCNDKGLRQSDNPKERQKEIYHLDNTVSPITEVFSKDIYEDIAREKKESHIIKMQNSCANGDDSESKVLHEEKESNIDIQSKDSPNPRETCTKFGKNIKGHRKLDTLNGNLHQEPAHRHQIDTKGHTCNMSNAIAALPRGRTNSYTSLSEIQLPNTADESRHMRISYHGLSYLDHASIWPIRGLCIEREKKRSKMISCYKDYLRY
ncbi:hypothetical protein PoB_005039100 [Plakobranchus ocellatus]|uniref:Uncharacterized protein n=1 Tax=Plakobranchus ocellatus TaxID=259542 RepID=A0AAV4BTT1_9GAST|nr:hypothetical protein PoB_005039100 [Plakobranchus ocellatus]